MQRSNGRSARSLRTVTFARGFQPSPAGSVLVSFGNTQVICAVSVSDDVPRWMRGQQKGWLTAEYAMLPSATNERSRREVRSGRQSGRSMEIQRLIGRSLRAVCDLTKLPEMEIVVDCDVVVADGGTRTAAITGAWVALHDAFTKIGFASALTGQVSAVSVGVVAGEVVCDLDYPEDSTAEVDMNLVMTDDGRFIEVQGTAEGKPFDRELLDEMLLVGSEACSQLHRLQREAVGT